MSIYKWFEFQKFANMTPTTDETRKRTPSDYVFGKVLGDGSFSTVFLARDIHTNKEYASKSTITLENSILFAM